MGVFGTESSLKDMKLEVKELVVGGKAVTGDAIAASDITVATFTTAGSTEISGNLQEVLEAIADLADPAG